MSKRGRPPAQDILTPREWEVFSLIREGLTNRAIAERLGISLSGAKHHVSEIISKLGVESREEAAVWRRERPLPVLAPFAVLLDRRELRPPALAAGVLAAAVTLIAAIAALTSRGDGVVLQAPQQQAAVATPTPEVVPEPQRSTIAGYDVGYGGGGGFFVSLQGNVLTLEEQVGAGTVSYVIDAGTRFLWAEDGRIRLDSSPDGLVDGTSVVFAFDSWIDGDIAAANGIPPDTVTVGYFKYMDGKAVSFGPGYVDVAVNLQLLQAAPSLFRLDDGVVRVWIDPNAEIGDYSFTRAGLQVGARVSFSGLRTAAGEPVAHKLSIQ